MKELSISQPEYKIVARSNHTQLGLNDLLGRLFKVKQTGHSRWIACCPAHHDKNPSLAIRDDNGTILLKCFAGCEAYQIVSAVGMQLADLFPAPGKCRRPLKNAFPAADVLRCIQHEVLIITVTACRIINGVKIDKADLDRLIVAYNLVEAAYD